MLKKILGLAALAGALLLTGCATVKPMAYSTEAAKPPAADQSVYLMTATFKNVYRTSYQPKMLVAHIERPDAQGRDDRLNFRIDDQGKMENASPETGNTYLLRMELPPGEYTLVGVTCMNKSFPILATYFIPVHAKITVGAPGTYYLGHVDATLRERQGNEFRAGAVIPLVDQAVGGGAGGTFDISITDRWTDDQLLFQSRFPAMKDLTVASATLPPFDRAYAQKWWEDH